MAEDNTDELASPAASVKNDSMAEDNTDELMSPVASVKNDSMAEDNTDELVNPVTSVESDSAGSKPDRISTRKSGSLSNAHKVLPFYRNSSSTSNNGGNTRRQSTGKLHSPDSGQHVLPHYLRASTGSCHDFCKYGKKHSSEPKPWHSLSKRKNKLPADEQSPAQALVGEAKKGTSVKQKPSTPPGSVLGEKKKVTGVDQKPSTSPGSMLGESKKRIVVKQNTFTTSGSSQGEAKKGMLVKKKPPTPPRSMLEEEKKVDVINQKPSAPQESILEDDKKVAMVEQKPSSPPGSIQGGVDEVTVVDQNSSASLESMLGEGEIMTAVEQKLSTPSGSALVAGEKVTLVNQKSSAPPGSMLGQGNKLNVVDQRPPSKVHSLEPSEMIKKKATLPPKSVHSLKLDSSSYKMPETEKKMKPVLVKHSPPEQTKLKMVKSSSKILGGEDAGFRKVGAVNSRKQKIVSKVSGEKSLKIPTHSCSPKSSSVKPLILRARNSISLKLLSPLKDQNKMWRDGTNKPKSASQSQSHLLSTEVDKKVAKSAGSASGKYTSSSKKLLHIAEAETDGKNQKKTLRKGKTAVSNDQNPSVVKLKFRRGKVIDLQPETSSPRRLTFRLGRHMGESQDSNIRKRNFRKKGVDDDGSNTIPNSRKIVLRHQDVQEKKDVQGLLNNVIEETASKLVETRKSKVKALVGAFETVISLQDKPSTVTVS